MNFTAKTKGSDGLDAGSDNLFFAEVTYGLGDKILTVNCCCIVNPFDNGIYTLSLNLCTVEIHFVI
jgi:hypothetical protein